MSRFPPVERPLPPGSYDLSTSLYPRHARAQGSTFDVVVGLKVIDGDTRTTIASMLARGLPREQIAARTGAPLRVVRIVEANQSIRAAR